jgi:hypothetical protein
MTLQSLNRIITGAAQSHLPRVHQLLGMQHKHKIRLGLTHGGASHDAFANVYVVYMQAAPDTDFGFVHGSSGGHVDFWGHDA